MLSLSYYQIRPDIIFLAFPGWSCIGPAAVLRVKACVGLEVTSQRPAARMSGSQLAVLTATRRRTMENIRNSMGVYQLSFIACKNRSPTVCSFSERVLKLNRADSSLVIIVCAVVRKEKMQSSISSSEIAFVTARQSSGGLVVVNSSTLPFVRLNVSR